MSYFTAGIPFSVCTTQVIMQWTAANTALANCRGEWQFSFFFHIRTVHP